MLFPLGTCLRRGLQSSRPPLSVSIILLRLGGVIPDLFFSIRNNQGTAYTLYHCRQSDSNRVPTLEGGISNCSSRMAYEFLASPIAIGWSEAIVMSIKQEDSELTPSGSFSEVPLFVDQAEDEINAIGQKVSRTKFKKGNPCQKRDPSKFAESNQINQV